MKKIIYLIQFLFVSILFIIFKSLGYKLASSFGAFVGSLLGPIFRSKKIITNNIKNLNNNIKVSDVENIKNEMWENYGRILADYMYIKNFRQSKLDNYLKIQGQEILEQIKNNKDPVVFISGHFNNFELMAMEIERSGINLAAIYRPLNNIFLNKIMERIRKKYICKHQIKKGISGAREIIKLYKKGFSIALMIDQRVSEGIKLNFFGKPAFTTTIPAQLVKRFDCKIVPIYIERINKFSYKMTINSPLSFEKNKSIEEISTDLNIWLEKMISNKPSQWIWSHNRWK